LYAGAILAAVGVGFAGYVYLGPYLKLTKVVRAQAAELTEERGSSEQMIAERDKLKVALDQHTGSEREKVSAASKQSASIQDYAAELKTALAAAGADVAVEDGRLRVALPAKSLFDQPFSTVISGQGDAALKVIASALKKTGMRGRVHASLIQSPPPRELAQFKNIGEFEMLRAARVMLLLVSSGVAADRVMVAGEGGGATAAPKKGRPAALPDRVDIDLEPA
jgi:outer membrane protein OmpA-like peptidoglycan-associated protein